jgi:hypothetical protein
MPFILLVVVQFVAAGSIGSQTPTLQIEFSDEQSLSGLEQAPLVQVPAGVQLFPPQPVPLATLASSQFPVTLLQVGVVWQVFWTHTTLWAVSATQVPLRHVSLGVQASLSALQDAPSLYA